VTKPKTIILAALTMLFAGCTMSLISGSGRIVRQDRAVAGFERVTISTSGDLTLVQGATEGLTIEADDNILPHIQTEVQDGTLVIRFDRENWSQVFRPSRPIKYTLAMKMLRGLAASGSVNITAQELAADDLRITVSGSSNVRIERLGVETLTYTLSGSGSVQVAGRAARQDLTISGSGRYAAGDLASDAVRASISGSGTATVWARDTLDARISGSGSIGYYGRPRVNQSISGSGKITSLGER
jgi:hypothetical protein